MMRTKLYRISVICGISIPSAAILSLFIYVGVVNKQSPMPEEKLEIAAIKPPAIEKISEKDKWGFNLKDSSFKDFDFTKTVIIDKAAQRKFKIEGKRMGLKNKQLGFFQIAVYKELCISNVKLTFYENDIPVSILTAERATLDIPAGGKKVSILGSNLNFSGNIFLVTNDKRTLVCDRLRWNSNDEKLYADGNCRLGYEGKRLRSDAIDSDVNLTDFTYSNDNNKLADIAKSIF
ncbi:MAG: hypothetical protein HQ572_06350 [Candidatus Omnitrophica bacterium]|nr:hypothetical protein [Candidatus Omnitrophota bacterium]